MLDGNVAERRGAQHGPNPAALAQREPSRTGLVVERRERHQRGDRGAGNQDPLVAARFCQHTKASRRREPRLRAMLANAAAGPASLAADRSSARACRSIAAQPAARVDGLLPSPMSATGSARPMAAAASRWRVNGGSVRSLRHWWTGQRTASPAFRLQTWLSFTMAHVVTARSQRLQVLLKSNVRSALTVGELLV